MFVLRAKVQEYGLLGATASWNTVVAPELLFATYGGPSTFDSPLARLAAREPTATAWIHAKKPRRFRLMLKPPQKPRGSKFPILGAP